MGGLWITHFPGFLIIRKSKRHEQFLDGLKRQDLALTESPAFLASERRWLCRGPLLRWILG